ncbi:MULTISPECIES: acetyl-CoA hydrolase/transferase family protein [Sciscionella]|uniref:acetyl-CoA hydrolase/transferase family protein n=1 Tax=Sciscionella TaxID=596495 RepID=UPI00036DCE44|nr:MULTISPECIES: acetyl-CoA hydrolase/transferase C-terminal domain-containing protein [Sciscionella]
MNEVPLEQLDLAHYVHDGDTIVWGQACAEPCSLTELLVRQRAEIGSVRCFVGIPATRTMLAEHADHIRFVSYCASGANRELAEAGVLDVLPVHYSTLPQLLSTGSLHADVVMLQLPPADESGRYSLGLADDYVSAAIGTARVVIAEVNDRLPWICGARTLDTGELDVVVHTSRAPAQLPTRRGNETMRSIAAHAADLIGDGATLQFGIGALPEAVLAELTDRRALGIHSGLLNDTAAELMEAGVVTNERKNIDSGKTVAGVLMGTTKLFRFAERNSAVVVRETGYTHDPAVLAGQDRFTAINSAVEVDLTGQVNAESVSGRYVGAVGGSADFLRGAARSRGGVPIVVLPATAGANSRIVTRLSGPVSVARSDAAVIVTEFGVADLRGQPLRARQEHMLAIAHPEHRRALEAAIEGQGAVA